MEAPLRSQVAGDRRDRAPRPQHGRQEERASAGRLRDWATKPQFSYRHKWTVGDTVIWDNTGTMHRATPYDPNAARRLHRTKLQGEEAFS